VELFRSTNIDFLGKKWFFLALSLIFSVAGIASMLFWHHIPLGVDFRGGTIVDIKFTQAPNVNAIRADLDRAGLKNARIQADTRPGTNELLISLDIRETKECIDALVVSEFGISQNEGEQLSRFTSSAVFAQQIR